MSRWNEYRKDKDLPHAQTIVSHFGTWNNFKEAMNLEQNQRARPFKYSDEHLLSLLEQYKEHYSSAAEWDSFAEKNSLPKHYIFIDRLGPDILFEKTGYVVKWTTEMLRSTILKHFPHSPPTQAEWTSLTQENGSLPSFITIIRHFDGWNKMKQEIYNK